MQATAIFCLASLTFLVAGSAGARAAIFQYEAFLDGPSESPPNASPGTGHATLIYDDVAHTMQIDVTWADLIGTTTVAHIHAPTAAPFSLTASPATQLPSFVGFPTGVTAGNYQNTFDLTLDSSWSAAFIIASGGTAAGAEAAFSQYLTEGRAYLNIHTSQFQSGEIRGFFVPEPASIIPAALGAIALVGWRLRRQRA